MTARSDTISYLRRTATQLARARPTASLSEKRVTEEIDRYRTAELAAEQMRKDALDRMGQIVREMHVNRGAWTQPWIAEQIGSSYQWVQQLRFRGPTIPPDIAKATADDLLADLVELHDISQRAEALRKASRARLMALVDEMIRVRGLWSGHEAHRRLKITWIWRSLHRYWDTHANGWRPPTSRDLAASGGKRTT